MKIHACAVSFILVTHALSSSALAFVYSFSSIPRTHHRQQRSRFLLTPSPSSTTIRPARTCLVTQLAFYPSDEPLPERLKNVQSQWENSKKDGVGKFFADELEAAERIIKGRAESAERSADDVISRGGDGDYLLKEGFRGMAETGKRLASEIWEVRQEFDELRVAKLVEETAEDVVSTDVIVEKDLEKVVENVVSSLKEAEDVVKAAIATVASKEGLADSAKVNFMEKLESEARNIEESINVADSMAKTAKQVVIEDEKVMGELKRTGGRLSDAIDATESLTETLKGTEGGEALDAVSSAVDQAAEIVRETLGAAESIADAVGQNVVTEADAVMAMGGKAADSVRSVRAARSSIEGSSGPQDSESLTSALTKDAMEIESDVDTAERLARAIERDTANDVEALEALERSSEEVNDLIDAVDGAMDRVEVTVGGELSTKIVTEPAEGTEGEVKEAKRSLGDVEKVVEECENCGTKEVEEKVEVAPSKMEVDKQEAVVAETNIESEVVEISAEEEEHEPGSELVPEPDAESKDGEGSEEASEEVEVAASKMQEEELLVDKKEAVVAETNIESEPFEISAEEKEREPESELVQQPAAESKMGERSEEASSVAGKEKEELLTQIKPKPVEELSSEPTTTSSANDAIGGEDSGEAPEAEMIADVDHNRESLGEAVASITDVSHHTLSDAVHLASNSISDKDLADVVVSTGPSGGLESVLTSTAGVASGVSDLMSSSDEVHHVATEMAEATAKASALLLSLFL